MKTMKQVSSVTRFAAILFVVAAVISACKNSDPISAEVSQTASNEAVVGTLSDEVDDMGTTQLNATDAAGRTDTGFDDDRVKCATITPSNVAGDKSSGTLTIDFGAGCTDNKGNVRKGKIIITWSGQRWFMPGATITIHFLGYSINDVKFSDQDFRTITNISTQASPLTFTIEASHKLTWPDNTTATRAIHHTRQWVRSTNVMDDKLVVSQTAGAANAAAGTNRYGRSYSVQITTPLEFSRSCAITNKVFKPVKGVVVITYGPNNKVVTIDFGSGKCDNTYTISAEGHSVTVSAKNDSSGD